MRDDEKMHMHEASPENDYSDAIHEYLSSALEAAEQATQRASDRLPRIDDKATDFAAFQLVSQYHLLVMQLSQLHDYRTQKQANGLPQINGEPMTLGNTRILNIDDALVSAYAEFMNPNNASGFSFGITSSSKDANHMLRRSYEQQQCLSAVFSQFSFQFLDANLEPLLKHVDFISKRAVDEDQERDFGREIANGLSAFKNQEIDESDLEKHVHALRSLTSLWDSVKWKESLGRLLRLSAYKRLLPVNAYPYERLRDGSYRKGDSSIGKKITYYSSRPAFIEFRKRLHHYFSKFSKLRSKTFPISRDSRTDFSIKTEAYTLAEQILVDAVLAEVGPGSGWRAGMVTTSAYIRDWVLGFHDPKGTEGISKHAPLLYHPQFLSAYDLEVKYDYEDHILNLSRSLLNGSRYVFSLSDDSLKREVERSLSDQGKPWSGFKNALLDDWKQFSYSDDNFFSLAWQSIILNFDDKNTPSNSKHADLVLELHKIQNEVPNIDSNVLDEIARKIDVKSLQRVEEVNNSYVEELGKLSDSYDICVYLPENDWGYQSVFVRYLNGKCRHAFEIAGPNIASTFFDWNQQEERRNLSKTLKHNELFGHLDKWKDKLELDAQSSSNDYSEALDCLISALGFAATGMWQLVIAITDKIQGLSPNSSNNEFSTMTQSLYREIGLLRNYAHRYVASQADRSDSARVKAYCSAWTALKDSEGGGRAHIRYRLARIGLLLEGLTMPPKLCQRIGDEFTDTLNLHGESEWRDSLTKSYQEWKKPRNPDDHVQAIMSLKFEDAEKDFSNFQLSMIAELLGILRHLRHIETTDINESYEAYLKYRAECMFHALYICIVDELFEVNLTDSDTDKVLTRPWKSLEGDHKLREIAEKNYLSIKSMITKLGQKDSEFLFTKVLIFAYEAMIYAEKAEEKDVLKGYFEIAEFLKHESGKLYQIEKICRNLTSDGFPRRLASQAKRRHAERLSEDAQEFRRKISRDHRLASDRGKEVRFSL